MQMRSGIYFILNRISLKLYIGSATYLVRRKSEHFSRLSKNIHHNEHLQRAYNFYGAEAFDFIIIELAPLDKLIELEKFYISKHRTTEEEFGYNKCEAGSGMHGRKHSPETIEKMKLARAKQIITQEYKDKISKTLKGRKHSEATCAKQKARRASKETKAKMSASHKARHAANPSLAAKGANARWRSREPLILTQPPIIISKGL